MRTAQQTAILLAVVLNRSDQNRARVSAQTVKMLAGRHRLRSAFLVELIPALAEFGWIFVEISSGGFGALQARTLEAAKPVTAKRFLTDDERRALRKGDKPPEAFENEVAPPAPDAEDDD